MRVLMTKNRFTMTSSNAPVENYSTWDSSTTYNTGDIVIWENKIWESMEDNNKNIEPPTNATKWMFISWTNPYKCLDEYINTQTAMNDETSLIMEFDVTNVNAVVLLNLEALKVIVSVYDINGNLVETIEKNALEGVTNWGDYFFGEYDYVNKMMIETTQLLKGKIKIEIQGGSGKIAKVGVVLIGFLEELGITLQGVKSSIDDYSKKIIDKNGNTYLQEGNYADRFEGKVLLDLGDFNKIKRKLTKLRGQPFYYTASEKDICRELDVYGFYENFEIDIQNPVKAECNLTLRGLI